MDTLPSVEVRKKKNIKYKMAPLVAKRRLIILRNPEHNSRRFRNRLLEIQKEGLFLRLLINKLTIKEGIASLLISKFSKNNSY